MVDVLLGFGQFIPEEVDLSCPFLEGRLRNVDRLAQTAHLQLKSSDCLRDAGELGLGSLEGRLRLGEFLAELEVVPFRRFELEYLLLDLQLLQGEIVLQLPDAVLQLVLPQLAVPQGCHLSV